MMFLETVDARSSNFKNDLSKSLSFMNPLDLFFVALKNLKTRSYFMREEEGVLSMLLMKIDTRQRVNSSGLA